MIRRMAGLKTIRKIGRNGVKDLEWMVNVLIIEELGLWLFPSKGYQGYGRRVLLRNLCDGFLVHSRRSTSEPLVSDRQ